MNEPTLKSLPKLERLLIDADIKPTLLPYLRAVGFNIRRVRNAKVDISKDDEIVRYSRHYKRILVCHDRHKDAASKVKVYLEIYNHGGQVIEITGSTAQSEFVSLGKLLLYHDKWVEFFKNNDGVARIYENQSKITYVKRDELIMAVQGIMPGMPVISSKSPKRHKVKRKPKIVASEQIKMLE